MLDETSVNVTTDIMEALVRSVHALEYFLTQAVHVLDMGIAIERNAIVVEVFLEKIVPKQQLVEDGFQSVMMCVQEEVIVLQKIIVFVMMVTLEPIVNMLCAMELALVIQMFVLDLVHVLA